MELENKFIVLKRADIEAALTEYEQRIFFRMIDCIAEYRQFAGKKQNSYVCINQDEPYFPDVLKLMEEAKQAQKGKTQ